MLMQCQGKKSRHFIGKKASQHFCTSMVLVQHGEQVIMIPGISGFVVLGDLGHSLLGGKSSHFLALFP